MLSTIAACGTLKKEIGLRRDSEAFLINKQFKRPPSRAALVIGLAIDHSSYRFLNEQMKVILPPSDQFLPLLNH